MDKLSFILKILIIAIIYVIIIFALRIMYKDIKGGGKKRPARRKAMGLEIIKKGDNVNLRVGAVIPLNGDLTIGRREDNTLILNDGFASSHHAKIFLKNTDYIIEDLGSTNGTFLNNNRLNNSSYLKKGDEIKIGTAIFKVIA